MDIKIILLFLVLVLLPTIPFADEIKCYSGGHLVYHEKADRVMDDGDFTFWDEKKSGKQVLTDLQCIISLDAGK